MYLGTGLVLTTQAERVSVTVLHRYSYAPAMPAVFGLGLAPHVQWIVVPLLILWLTRTYVVGRLTLKDQENLR